MTRRESTNERDDDPLQIVGHRLDKVEANAREDVVGAEVSRPAPQLVAPVPRAIQGARSGRTRTIALRQVVLVDREIDALRDIAIALRDEYDFHITISGTEALNLLRGGGIDTIVVGQTLYSSTGLNVLAEARRLAPQTQRVLLANAVEAGAVERGATAVAPFRVLQRPCTADKLRDLLDTATSTQNDSAPSATQEQVRIQPQARVTDPAGHNPADFEHVILETHPEPKRKAKSARKELAAETAALPVVVYTDNAEFYQAIATALQERHEVRLCTQLERAAEFAEQGQCPLLITDRAATQVELQRISIALRALDGGVITIASGPPEAGSALRKLLGTGALHSFLPKPINAPLVRLSVESAKRQYLESRALKNSQPEMMEGSDYANPQLRPTSAGYFVPSQRADFKVDDYADGFWRRHGTRVAGGVAIVVAAAAAGWFGWQALRPPAVDGELAHTLTIAQQEFEAGRYTAPGNAGALHLFAEALRREPGSTAARFGLDQSLERVLVEAESALLAEQLDTASSYIEAIRVVEPGNRRLPFLEAQLRKSRMALAATTASLAKRETPTASAISRSAEIQAPTTRPLNGQIGGQTQRIQAAAGWLATARQRLAQDRLTSPVEDNAEYYLRQAERADPNNQGVQQGLRDLGARLLANATSAVERQQLDAARRFLADAVRLGAAEGATQQLQRDIDASANTQARMNFLRLTLQRVRDNRLFEPERDSAKYYLGQLERLDPNAAETQQAGQALALRLIDNSNQAIEQKQLNAAAQLLNETRRMGYAGPELTAAEARLRAARSPTPVAAPAASISAIAPKPIRTAAPRFPDDAMRAGVEGWVDVGFRITATGEVVDVVALASSPGKFAPQFERAAVNALSQYRYPPADGAAPRSMVQKVQFRLSPTTPRR